MSKPIRHGAYPEITWQAILVGYVIGALITLCSKRLVRNVGWQQRGGDTNRTFTEVLNCNGWNQTNRR